jgi:hypothetical protein
VNFFNGLRRNAWLRVVSLSICLLVLFFLFLFFSNEGPRTSIPNPINDNDQPAFVDLTTRPTDSNPSHIKNEEIPTEFRSRAARLLFRSKDGKELPSELKVVLECSDKTMRLTVVKKIQDSKEFEVDSIPANLCAVTLLHPDFLLQTSLELYQGRNDGLVGVVTCFAAPILEVSGLSELAIGIPTSPFSKISVSAPRPIEWDEGTIFQRYKLILESKVMPCLQWFPRNPDNLCSSQIIPSGSNLDKVKFSLPMVGSGILNIFGESSLGRSIGATLDRQNIELRSGETTFIDLRRLNLANLIATYALPNSWTGEIIRVALSQRDDSGSWREIRSFSEKSTGELFFVGLRPVETRLSLVRSGSPSLTVLPTERELLLKPGENRFEQVFGDAREFTVHAPLGKTSFGHEGQLEWEIQRDGRVLARDCELAEMRVPLRYCLWPSDEVRFIYKTFLKGYSSRDFIVDECVLAPNQSEVFFEPRQGSAVQLSGVNWRDFAFLLVLQGQNLVKTICLDEFPASAGSDPLSLSLPQGLFRLVFLPQATVWTSTQTGLEVQFAAPHLKPGEIVPMQVEARTLATRKLRFVGNGGDYEICVIDQIGQAELKTLGTYLIDSVGNFPEDVPLYLISRRTGLRQRLELKDLPEGEVQTIELP